MSTPVLMISLNSCQYGEEIEGTGDPSPETRRRFCNLFRHFIASKRGRFRLCCITNASETPLTPVSRITVHLK
jgi:hypothetical protein